MSLRLDSISPQEEIGIKDTYGGTTTGSRRPPKGRQQKKGYVFELIS